MKIKLYRSATVGIDLSGFKILQDPWLTDGEYYGSWSHYPFYDLKSNLNEINSYNAIYISHIHPDHCSDDTLKLINKKIPIYIHSYHTKFLKNKLERFGFKVIELANNKRHQLAQNAYINIYAADNCNPELCYKFTACADLTAKEGSQQIDTLSVIDDGKNILINVNDCPFDLAKSTFKEILKQYQKIDLLLTGYGGAGPYPQCFENLNISEKKTAAKKKENQFLNQAISYIKMLKPKYYLPFAGTYTLTGKLAKLQNIRGVPDIDSAYDFFEKYFNSNSDLKQTQALKINPGVSFDISTGESNNVYKKINFEDYKNYIETYLVNKKLNYENEESPGFDELYELSKGAFLKFNEKKLINNIKLKTDIYVDLEENLIKLPKDKNTIEVISKKDFKSDTKFVCYKTDKRLLKKLLQGLRYAHWNNAEIGSHIRFYRNPNVFEREVYMAMCFFHN